MMGRPMIEFLARYLLPLLLLVASLLDWSLINLIDLLLFFAIQFSIPRKGLRARSLHVLSWCIMFYSILVLLAHTTFYIVWVIEGKSWTVSHGWWAKLIGFERDKLWGSASIIYFVILQLSAAVVALVVVSRERLHQDSCCLNFLSLSGMEHIGHHCRVISCLLLPAVQLIVSISNPSWISLPFFIFSSIGLVDWSLTSNFLGLFRCWRPLEIYAVFNVLLVYVYQLPISFPSVVTIIGDFIGLYKITSKSDWTEISSGLALLVYYFMLSGSKHDLQEMDSIMSTEDNSLTERLLQSRHSFFIRQSLSGKRHTNVLLRGYVFRNFSINFFTYGFPVLLLALSLWSFNFMSICAFGLLAYVGYILYAFPSVFQLHRLNGSLLVFILLWAASTYVFNVAFTFVNKKFQKDMVIWETVGLWHYSIPGLFLLAQFCLGVFVALCNLVNNSVFLYLSGVDGQSSNDDQTVEENEDTKVLIVATVAWGLRKCSRAITLALLFFIATKPGFIHAAYMCFFLVFLVSHSISKELRQILILFCEIHFSVLYLLQLNMVSNALEHSGPYTAEILKQIGLSNHAPTKDFMQIGLLICFCAVHNHGFKMLFSLSAVLQNTPYPPVGFSILKAGLNKSVLLSVYASQTSRNGQASKSSYEKRIATYLSKVSQKFLTIYRSYGTYVAFLTILLTLCIITPNYISFGYLFFLLFWIIGRQLVEMTSRRLWFPLKVYATVVFIFIFCLSISPIFAAWISKHVVLYPDLGFDPKASVLKNVWQSLAVLVVMQLYSYERRQSRGRNIGASDASKYGIMGFLRRLLIWHIEKILSLAAFYASLSSVSLFGFIYLLGVICFSTLPKSSRIPSKVYLIYTGLHVTSEYLFQMWCRHAEMCPGQQFYSLSLFWGFKYYESGFWGLEYGLRAKILVIVACILQYNVFRWLDVMPASLVHDGKWEEPCQLFVSNDVSSHGSEDRTEQSKGFTLFSRMREIIGSRAGLEFSSNDFEISEPLQSFQSSDYRKKGRFLSNILGGFKESHRWNKKRILALKKDRFEMQKTTFLAYMRFWTENIFKLCGLEINMLVLLLASFTLLNAASIFYIFCLVVCILLSRDFIRKLWPLFVILFASVLVFEYFALWKDKSLQTNASKQSEVYCRDCWRSSNTFFNHCVKCWLGIVVDDPRMLVSYYIVFIFSTFKLRSSRFSGFSDTYTYRRMRSQRQNASVWKDLSFETKSFWTFLDYLRLYAYCHLLDIVLVLILVTGTLEYDVLHLGYLGFALVFFRMRLEILKKRNKIFRYLRMYNFTLIVLSLAYQSPFVGDLSSGRCDQIDYLYEIIGLYKYDYGFRLTSRSAFVEIVIFMLVSVQSYIFGSSEFDYVARYLEAEQIGAMVREQEKNAARKTEQLQEIRNSEEQKRQRDLQVEKLKTEMLNLRIQLKNLSSVSSINSTAQNEGLRRRRNSAVNKDVVSNLPDSEVELAKEQASPEPYCHDISAQGIQDKVTSEATPDLQSSLIDLNADKSLPKEPVAHSVDSVCEITEIDEDDDKLRTNVVKIDKSKAQQKENPLKSAVQLLGDGVSQVQSLGNQAVTNIVSFLNIEDDELHLNEHSFAEDDVFYEIESQQTLEDRQLDRVPSSISIVESKAPVSLQIGVIFRFIWSQMRRNNDYVCYCCFILVFLWNFSLMSMVYLAALFLYALCVNSGPDYLFWIIMLIYSELNILSQYVYQIIIQHCGLNFHLPILQMLGFPEDTIKASFVVSILPLFMVYIFTLLESSITTRDGEWAPITEFSLLGRKSYYEEEKYVNHKWNQRLCQLFVPVFNLLRKIGRSFSTYWLSLTQGAESPPYFVQVTMEVGQWPDDGIQPERIESRINKLLTIVHEERCKHNIPSSCHSSSKVRIHSIDPSKEHENLALAVLEVVYASPLDSCHEAEWYRSLTPAEDVAKEIRDSQIMGLLEEVEFPYPVVSVVGGGKREVDLYAYVFGSDLAVFFLVAMFYQSLIKNNSEFLDVYQLEDQFPKEFVFILMVLFFLIVVDRIIYLWSFAIGKVLFYLFSLILFTYSVTEYAWYLEPSHRDIGGLVLRAIYLTKSISLVLQAMQIRFGVPNKSTLYRQYLTSKVTQVNYLGFRLYRALPFLYELRCVLDWSCTSTSLTMYDWLKLEDIYASLFLVKCDVTLNRDKHELGQKQTMMTKFCSGICLFFILICVIWAPMLIYSSGNPTNIANPVLDVTVQIDIKASGGRLTLFKTTACQKISWEYLEPAYNFSQNYLDTYNVEDIQLICCQPDATEMWLIPSAVKRRFIQSLDKSKLDSGNMQLILNWIFLRARPKGKDSVKYESSIDNGPSVTAVKEVLNGESSWFRITDAYPTFFRLTGSGEARRLEPTVDSVTGDLFLNNGTIPFWSFYISNSSYLVECEGMNGPMAIVVSEETPQGILGETLSKFSIWSLYITFVLAVARFIRIQCSDLRMRIPYENLPSCDRLIAICEGIYAARAEGELQVEEVLYMSLVEIYRSPHVLLEYTELD